MLLIFNSISSFTKTFNNNVFCFYFSPSIRHSANLSACWLRPRIRDPELSSWHSHFHRNCTIWQTWRPQCLSSIHRRHADGWCNKCWHRDRNKNAREVYVAASASGKRSYLKHLKTLLSCSRKFHKCHKFS